MGKQHAARLHVDGRTYEGEALLETAEVIFRGERRLVIPFAKIKSVTAADGRLVLNDDTILDLGDEAAKWAEKIRNPKTVIQKLGVKAGQRVAVVHLDDDAFVADLEKAGCAVTSKPAKNSDAIFYGASSRDDLSRLATLKASLAQNGALWVIRPKGVKTITESDTMAAGKAAGLVDVKVVKFSETRTAEKFVIRIADRR